MNLHEFQAKGLFREYGLPVPSGRVARTQDEAVAAARSLGGERWVVKAQIHAGGRGQAGGVRIVDDAGAVGEAAAALLGGELVTAQTGPRGRPVDAVLIEPADDLARELYLGLLVDRSAERIAVVASDAGGMDIESVAHEFPERIHSLEVDPAVGLQPYQGRWLAFALGLAGRQIRAFGGVVQSAYRLFIERDASLLELNPLAVTAAGELLAVDAKLVIDDNALYRHPDLAGQHDTRQDDPTEAAAHEHGLNYITLDGDIACMVNGAGLAMATMDLVKLHGGAPANFLDVGGGTTADRVAEAFKLILSDDKVRAILVNIFGGIVRCDLIAEGLVQAVGEVRPRVPVVARLAGTQAERGRAILAESGLAIVSAADLDEAARRVVEAAAK